MGAVLVFGQALAFTGCTMLGIFTKAQVSCQMQLVTVPLPVAAEGAQQ